MNTAHICNDKS